jgi:hypothetical protein
MAIEQDSRVAIVEDARNIKLNGFTPPDSDPLKLSRWGFRPFYGWKSKEAKQIYYTQKPERYKLMAVLIDDFANAELETRHQRGPMGLIAGSNLDTPPVVSFTGNAAEEDPYDKLYFRTSATLNSVANSQLSVLRKKSGATLWSPLVSVYSRYLQNLNFYDTHFVHGPVLNKIFKPDDEEIFSRGYGTALGAMIRVAKLVPALHQRELKGEKPQPSALSSTLYNSFPTVASLAMLRLAQLNRIDNVIERPENFKSPTEVRAEFFDLVESKNGYRVTLGPALESILAHPAKENVEHSIHIGCAAMVNFDGQSAVYKLWEWVSKNVDRFIYPELYS